MLRSMTGFGRYREALLGKEITVEIKAVNHRNFEFSSRVSRGYSFLEDKLKGMMQKYCSRGKVDVFLSIVSIEETAVTVELDKALAKSYVESLRSLAEYCNIKDDISVSTVARYTDIFNTRRVDEDEDAVCEAVLSVAAKAAESFVAMREAEGEKLKADIITKLDRILELVEIVDEKSPQTVEKYRSRLYDKLNELLGDSKIDEQRILTECAIFADKVAVDEETVRLRTHVGEFKKALNTGSPIGKKLDFMLQEMNRESNTIGSKSQSTELAYVVVELKSEIEKIREQIQNIE